MKKLLVSILFSLGLIVGCASLKGGSLSNTNTSNKQDFTYKITVSSTGATLESNKLETATTQKSNAIQPSVSGPASTIKTLSIGQLTADKVGSVKETFQKAPVTSILLSLIFLGGGVLAWFLGYRIVAIALGAVLILSTLAPQYMIWGALGVLGIVAFLLYRKYTKATVTANTTSNKLTQVVSSVETAMGKVLTDPVQKAAFKTNLAASQDSSTQAAVATITSGK